MGRLEGLDFGQFSHKDKCVLSLKKFYFVIIFLPNELMYNHRQT